MASEATTKLRKDLVKRVKEEYNLDSIGVAEQKFKDLSASEEGKIELMHLLSFGFKGDFQDIKTIICGDAASCVNIPTWKLFSNPFVKWLSLTTQSFTDVVVTTNFEVKLKQMSLVDVTAMTDEEWWTWLTTDVSFAPLIDDTGIVIRLLNGIKTKYMSANNLIPRSYLIKNIRRILTDRNMSAATGFPPFLEECVRMDKNFLLKCGITVTLDFALEDRIEKYNNLKTKAVFGMKGYQDRMIAAIEQAEYADLIKRVHTELVKPEYSDYTGTPLVTYINTLNTAANPATSADPPTPSATYLQIKYLESADMGLVKELMTGGDVSGYSVVRRLFANARNDRTFPPFAQVKNIFYKMNNKEDWNNWIRLLSNPYWSSSSPPRIEGDKNVVDQCYIKHYLCSSSCDDPSASAAPGCPTTYSNDRPQSSGSSSKAHDAITRLKDDLRKPTSSSQDTSISRTNDLIDHIKYTKYRVMALIVLVIITMYQYANLYTGLRSMSSEIFKGLAVLMIVIIVYFYLSVTISTFWTNTVASKNTTPQEEPGETITEPVPTLSTPNVDITRNAIDAYTRSLPKP